MIPIFNADSGHTSPCQIVEKQVYTVHVYEGYWLKVSRYPASTLHS